MNKLPDLPEEVVKSELNQLEQAIYFELKKMEEGEK
jgi:hypothetical protein